MFSTGNLLKSASSNVRRNAGTVLLFALPLASLGRAQSVELQLSSGSAAAGSSVTLNLNLKAAAALPAAVQWTLAYSTVDFGSPVIAAGPAATEARKQLSCRSHVGSTSCLIWGLNTTTISNGILATVSLPITHTSDSSSRLQLTSSSAATSSGAPMGTTTAGGSVTIEPGISRFKCVPVSLTAPASSACVITLTAAAPAGGATITLGSTSASAATVPASVTVPQGFQMGTFSVTRGTEKASEPVILTASYLGVSQVLWLKPEVSPQPPRVPGDDRRNDTGETRRGPVQ
jgi:hypothetical protein